jgi:predicted TIM-barrel fold metal-dependent hydrolase
VSNILRTFADRNSLRTGNLTGKLAAILAVAAERCVWGSDWPFTPPPDAGHSGAVATGYRPLSYTRLVDDFVAAAIV